MKNISLIFTVVVITTLTGCTSTTVAFKPVGPCSASHRASDTNGCLRVFSLMEGQSEGDDLQWYQHSAYLVCSAQGKRIKYVGNTVGKFDETPATVTLPPGLYVVKARAEGERFVLVNVPVVIKAGCTEVHLESGWVPAPGAEIVKAPSGYAVGWLADNSEPPSSR